MRRKHSCPLCEKKFSRRWNRDRHLCFVHQSVSPCFSLEDVEQANSKFNYGMSRLYDSPNPSFSSFRLQRKDPVDQSLHILHKLAEFKRLTEYIASTPIRRSVNHFAGHSFKSYNDHNTALRTNYGDLEIVGYRGFLCRSCLIAHPLPLYRDNSNNQVTIHQTKHHCNPERLLEIQRSRVDKKNYLADLYKNHLPILMLRTIEDWISGPYLLEAVEASSPNNACKFIYVSSQKEWARRVIHDKKTTLTFDELVDFISITKYKTYSYFKMKTD